MRIFNITLPFYPRLYKWRKDAVSFSIIAQIIMKKSVLLKADSFTLVSENNKNEVCLTKYIGPSLIAYNQKKHSFCLLGDLTQPNIIYRTIYRLISCSKTVNKPDLSALWKPSKCWKKESYIKEKAVQSKTTDTENYVYCKLNNITVFTQTSAFPLFVFTFTNRASFKINNVKYKSK